MCLCLDFCFCVCERASTLPVGKGGIQGLCKWVCVQYMCVIMGMWWYKCGVCITCMSISVCVCVCVFVCGLHMLPITSPICVNHHRRRNRVRHSDDDLKDIREEGEPVTGPCQASLPDKLYSHKLHSIRSCFTLGFLCAMACIHTLLRRLQII